MVQSQLLIASGGCSDDFDWVVILVDALHVARVVSRKVVGLHGHGDGPLHMAHGIFSGVVLDPLQIAPPTVQGVVVIILRIKLAVSAATIGAVSVIALNIVIIVWADLSTTTVLAVWAVATL